MPAKGEQTRQHILDRAETVFLQKGFAAASISDLTAAAGVTKGSLYFHFASKEEVGLAVLERAGETFLAFLDSALTGPTPGARLRNFLHRVCAYHRERAGVGGCLFGNTALEASDTEPGYAGCVANIFAAWSQRLATEIAAAQQVEQMRGDIPAAAAARFIIATLEGSIMQARLDKDDRPLTDGVATLCRLLELRA